MDNDLQAKITEIVKELDRRVCAAAGNANLTVLVHMPDHMAIVSNASREQLADAAQGIKDYVGDPGETAH